MKIYYDAGLKHLAEGCGFRGEILTSLQRCSNFKCTHHFLLQSWEALYRHLLQTYVSTNVEIDEVSLSDIMSAVKGRISQCNKECQESKSIDALREYVANLSSCCFGITFVVYLPVSSCWVWYYFCCVPVSVQLLGLVLLLLCSCQCAVVGFNNFVLYLSGRGGWAGK